MEKLIIEIKQEESVLIKIIIITMLLFGANVYFSFATDTYCVLNSGFKASAIDMATRNGRPIIGLIYELHYLSGLSNRSFYYISTVLALLFLSASIWLYQRILAKHGMTENIRILVSFAAICNIFIIEYFMFIEKCGFMLAVLFNIVALYFFENFLEKRNHKYLAGILLAMTMAIFTYQGTVALYVILALPFVFKYTKCLKDYLVNITWLIIFYAIPVLIDMIAFRFVFKSARISEEIHLWENCKNVAHGLLKYGMSTYDILPKNMFLIISIFVFLAAIVLAVKHKNKILCVLNIFAIVVASIVFSTATIIQGSGWWATRTTYPIASVIGVLVVHLFINSYDLSWKSKNIKVVQKFSVTMIGILMICQYFSFNSIYIDKYKVNALDEYRYNYIGQAISEYQKSTGIKITKISFYSDAERTYPAYPNLYSQGDLVVSAIYPEWSDMTALNYYLNSNYEKAEPLEQYIKYFASKNWNQLSKEQLIFDGETLHLCVY